MSTFALVVAALPVATALVAMLTSVRVHVTVKGRGELGQTWVLGAGVRWWLVTLSMAAAHGTDSVMQLHVAGRLWQTHRFGDAAGGLVDRAEWSVDRLTSFRRRAERYLHLDGVGALFKRLRRHIRVATCRGHLVYSTSDVAVTGMISGGLYALAGLLSPFGDFAIVPQWDAVARAEGNVDIVLRLWPFRLMVDAAIFVLRNIRVRSRPAAQPALAQS